ncbi:hypothetical protein MJN76_30595, partial [Salmonella enterica subsp. enterica serovar Anatum]|nr:hypothetical protein [Salmonella enterica subsp. enterica serovar Anatum]
MDRAKPFVWRLVAASVCLLTFYHLAHKDLNQLWNDGLAIKSRGRPVYFLHRQALETLLGRQLEESERE